MPVGHGSPESFPVSLGIEQYLSWSLFPQLGVYLYFEKNRVMVRETWQHFDVGDELRAVGDDEIQRVCFFCRLFH